jgi:diaminopimelate decarboxylase
VKPGEPPGVPEEPEENAMSAATRTAYPNGAARTAAEAVATGLGDLPHDDLPLVVLDLDRARRRYTALREAFPWVDVLYDASALAHPRLLAAVADADGGFAVTHDQALPALLAAGVGGRRILHATPVAHPHESRAAYDAGVRHFVVDGTRALESFSGAPDDLRVILRLRSGLARRPAHRAACGMTPDEALTAATAARALGVRIAGLSLALPEDGSPAEYVAEIVRAVGVAADIAAATGFRLRILDLGDGFPGRSGDHPAERAELARAIRGIVAPATSGVTVTAAAGRAVAAGCVTVVAGESRCEVDPATVGELIDAGAEVVVLDAGSSPLHRLPLLRLPLTRAGAPGHRIFRRALRG